MSQVSLITLKCIGEIPEEMLEMDHDENIVQELKVAIDDILNKYGLGLHEWEIMTHQLSEKEIVRCDKCHEWLVDRVQVEDRKDFDVSIKDGAELNGQVLCKDCLPLDHAWSWKNT